MNIFLVLLCAGLFQLLGSARAAETNAPAKHPTEFKFDGGDLESFVAAIRGAFGVELYDIAEIDQSMLRHQIRVPKMRIPEFQGERLDFRKALNLYNEISQNGAPSLGRWIIQGPSDRDPQAILLVPPDSRADSTFAVKAFALPGNPESREQVFKTLANTVTDEQERLFSRGYPVRPRYDLSGGLHYHGDTGIVVVTGGQTYVELASAIIEAVKEKERNKVVELRVPPSEAPQKPAPKKE